jgi:glycolate oxidase FAD binding subunit
MVDDLRSLVGADGVGEREGKVVASPRTNEEVAAVTRYANERGLAIEIVGTGTKRGWGDPVAAEILLETHGLAGVRSHSWQDLTATVAAGTTWAAMQRELAVHGQFVALDPLWPETATVGGIVATNDSGALRLKYGSLRDLIIGMTIVLADGTIAKSGGKVVKNVAGYDLHKLMTGAFGTLGVIADVTFRLHPLPAETRTWTVSSANVAPIEELTMKVLGSRLSTRAMQMRAGQDGFALDIQLATVPEALSEQIATLNALARELGIEAGSLTSKSADVFNARGELLAEPGVIVKATMLASFIGRHSASVVKAGGCAVTQATGIMFAQFSEEDAGRMLPSFYERVEVAGGSLTVLRAQVRPLPEWAARPWPPDASWRLMREIKRQFDPRETLNPKRLEWNCGSKGVAGPPTSPSPSSGVAQDDGF